ncbi:MAG TPA: nuclease-related domain-containing protein [Chloroflexota bacterium]|nr:nuclease-related domain-containing protein [Chloroflexota bacterium]
MQVTTNEKFVSRRAAIGRWSTIAGFIVLIVGMYVSLQPPQRSEQFLVPWFTLIVGIILLNVGKYNSMRWGTNPRVDKALAQALKGFDHRYHLFNYSPSIPTDHLLVTPFGAVVLETRPFFGDVIHTGSQWRRPMNFNGFFHYFSDGGLGNPTKEAQRDVEAIQNLLKERLGADDGGKAIVLPIIVMTNPRLKLDVTNPDIAVVKLADLRGGLRQLKEAPRLPADLQRKLVSALQGEPASPGGQVSSTRSNTWLRTQK